MRELPGFTPHSADARNLNDGSKARSRGACAPEPPPRQDPLCSMQESPAFTPHSADGWIPTNSSNAPPRGDSSSAPLNSSNAPTREDSSFENAPNLTRNSSNLLREASLPLPGGRPSTVWDSEEGRGFPSLRPSQTTAPECAAGVSCHDRPARTGDQRDRTPPVLGGAGGCGRNPAPWCIGVVVGTEIVLQAHSALPVDVRAALNSLQGLRVGRSTLRAPLHALVAAGPSLRPGAAHEEVMCIR